MTERGRVKDRRLQVAISWVKLRNIAGVPDAVQAVSDWLQEVGYPLEYQVARELQTAGFRTWQGAYYKDPEGDRRTREIDVVASIWPDRNDETITASVELVVEVKHSHEPWVVLTTELPMTAEDALSYRLITGKGGAPIRGLTQVGPVPELLTIPDRHGFNIQQSKARGNDTNAAYIALTGVVKAAAHRHKTFHGSPGIFFPVIVLGGALVELGYDASGQQLLRAIDWQRVRWHGSSALDRGVIVDVVQKDYLPTWAQDAHAGGLAIYNLLEAWVTR